MQKIDVIEAAKALDLPEDELQAFEVEDFVNTDNVLKGYISRRKDYRYGALYITHVNSKVARQIVYGTPKIHYPFDKLGRWTWPKVKSLNVYTKYDGTCVTAFTYRDHNECLYVSYKTRLTPTVQSGKFGAFREMWFEMLEKYPGIPKVVREMNFNRNGPGFALSFELFGSRNFHLINYDVPLDTRLLFGIKQSDASILDPEELFIIPDTDRMPPIPEKQTLKSGHDVNSFYTKLVEEQEAMNTTTEFGIDGGEGYIFYVRDEHDKAVQYKCLDGHALICTKQGWLPINKIVKHEIDTEVLTVLPNETLGWRRITNYYRTKRDGRPMVRITLAHHRKLRKNVVKGTNVTTDHKFLTMRGWVPAGNLGSTDLVATGNLAPNSLQAQLLNGMFLGDAHIRPQGGIRSGQAEQDHQYIKLKEKALKSLGASSTYVCMTKYHKCKQNQWVINIPVSNWVRRERLRWYPNDKKVIPIDIELTPLTLASWYMDDGSLNDRTTSSFITLATMCFVDKDIQLLREKLRALGMDTTFNTDRTLRLNTDSSRIFMSIVRPYIPDCMKRKILAGFGNYKSSLWSLGKPSLEYDTPILMPDTTIAETQILYCLDIDETHNFVTTAGVVHNCKPKSILDVHWAVSLSRINIVSACYKAIENSINDNETSVDDVKNILKEDCDSRQVEAYHDRIVAVLEQVKEDYGFRDRVRALYQEAKAATHTTITQDKVAIMRWMSKQFASTRMGYVYFVLVKGGID